MNQPWMYVSPILNPSSHVSPHPIPQCPPRTPALNTLFHASNLDWRSISRMIIYMFQCHSPKSPHPHPVPQSPKTVLYICVSFLSRIQGYHYHLSKFHIYALVFCIGVFLFKMNEDEKGRGISLAYRPHKP